MRISKTEIIRQNAWDIFNYFSEALKDYNRLPDLTRNRADVEDSLNALQRQWLDLVTSKDEKALVTLHEAIKSWLEINISQTDWSRCLTRLRQKRFCEKNKMRFLQLPMTTYIAVHMYAEKLKIPMWKVVDKLMKEEYERRRDDVE